MYGIFIYRNLGWWKPPPRRRKGDGCTHTKTGQGEGILERKGSQHWRWHLPTCPSQDPRRSAGRIEKPKERRGRKDEPRLILKLDSHRDSGIFGRHLPFQWPSYRHRTPLTPPSNTPLGEWVQTGFYSSLCTPRNVVALSHWPSERISKNVFQVPTTAVNQRVKHA